MRCPSPPQNSFSPALDPRMIREDRPDRKKVRMSAQFNFGSNWRDFSRNALSPERIKQATTDFDSLLSGVPPDGRSFLDIGFGQGLTLLLAASEGATVVGCDINPVCAEVFEENRKRYFPQLDPEDFRVIVGSILDENVVQKLRAAAPGSMGAYDIVHSWGVLHHTGNMKQAIEIAASLVKPGGNLILAIYARHWSSPAWWAIKYIYVHSPAFVQKLLIGAFYPIIYLAKWVVTCRRPTEKARGMDFFYDVIDWVGGYPYEYATAVEIIGVLRVLGFEPERVIAAEVPTGCNQFIFKATAKNRSS
jgi:2-polyprenyl-3-methyl-5-hydroxy-6-metoxy-1,4-benzoquinol methylase